MSSGRVCRQHGREHWYVVVYRANRSAFNGYRFTPSDYSQVRCAKCGATWRTKAAYVERLPGAIHPHHLASTRP
jgi:hypothetical protein